MLIRFYPLRQPPTQPQLTHDVHPTVCSVSSRGQSAEPAVLCRRRRFTLRDMYEQFQNIMKMGSLSTVMSMIPVRTRAANTTQNASELARSWPGPC